MDSFHITQENVLVKHYCSAWSIVSAQKILASVKNKVGAAVL